MSTTSTDQGLNFASLIESVADSQPEALALAQGDRRLSWAGFDERGSRFAAGLRSIGLAEGSKVAMYLHNGNEYLEAILGAFKARATPANVNYRYVEEELAYLLEDADAEAILFTGALAERVDRVRHLVPTLKASIQVDDGHPLLAGAVAYEELLASVAPLSRTERSGDDLCLLYTGGTTGRPKGVMWRQRDGFAAVAPMAYRFSGATPPERNEEAGERAGVVRGQGMTPVALPAPPLMHGTAFMTSVQALLLGGAVVTLEGRSLDSHELWRAVERERVTQVTIVGDAFARPMVRALDEAVERGRPYDLSSLRLVVSSGAMWSASVKADLARHKPMMLVDSLSASEGVGFAISLTPPGIEPETARFVRGERTKVFTEDGREVEPGSGEVGLLAVGGPIPLGYHKDPVKTAATFRTFGGNRYSVPGDFARVDADGTIFLLGRGSGCINTAGEKVFPEEVEEVLKEHPAVADCAVVGVPDERWGEAVTAVVALEEGSSASEEELIASTKGRLAGFKSPKRVVFVDAVPRGAAGKVDYSGAREAAHLPPGRPGRCSPSV
ncbi:MAG: AMP-binding protein [Acidimicrobiia bacterium]